eukprot:6473488-Amphidinium_carterae.1
MVLPFWGGICSMFCMNVSRMRCTSCVSAPATRLFKNSSKLGSCTREQGGFAGFTILVNTKLFCYTVVYYLRLHGSRATQALYTRCLRELDACQRAKSLVAGQGGLGELSSIVKG